MSRSIPRPAPAGPWLRQGFTFLHPGPAAAGLVAVSPAPTIEVMIALSSPPKLNLMLTPMAVGEACFFGEDDYHAYRHWLGEALRWEKGPRSN